MASQPVSHPNRRGRTVYLLFNRPIGGLTPLVQVRDEYCGSRRFSVVWCETSRYRLKVYYSFRLFDDQELIPSTLPIARTPSEEIGFTLIKFLR